MKHLLHNTLNLIDKLIELNSSTTIFLESLRGEQLKVMVESQTEKDMPTRCTIIRVVKLFFDSSEVPVLYCKSTLNKDKLTREEYQLLMAEELSIGILFHQVNNGNSIQKKNISINKEVNPVLAMSLNVKSSVIFKKDYEYWVGDREVGHICEFFNDESLARV